MYKRTTSFARIALAVPEQRRALGLSLNETAKLAGVSRGTVARIERGHTVNPMLVVKVAVVLTVVELYAPLPLDPLVLVQPHRRPLETHVPQVLAAGGSR